MSDLQGLPSEFVLGMLEPDGYVGLDVITKRFCTATTRIDPNGSNLLQYRPEVQVANSHKPLVHSP
jgi:hypothetical protein